MNALLTELIRIIDNSQERHLRTDLERDVKWIIELPMTDSEMKRFREILSEIRDWADKREDNTKVEP